MNKKGKNKLMPLMVLMILLVSVFTIIPQSLVADPYVFPDGTNGSAFGLTPGQTITYRVTNNSLNESEDYTIWVQGTKWIELGDGESTSDGDIEIDFNCPGWNELNQDPIGTWTLELHDESNQTAGAGYDYDIEISNYHYIRYKYDGDFVDYLIYNETYTPFYVYVYNWTGSKYELHEDVDLDIAIYDPEMLVASQSSIDTGIWDLDLTNEDLNYLTTGNYEYYLWVNVTEGTDHYTNLTLPVRLDVTADLPEDAVWGDTIQVTGYVYDGQGDGIPDYTVRLYSPVNGGYYNVYETDTYSTGRYTLSASTGIDVDFASAGTWYVGTYFDVAGAPERINDADMYEHPIDDPNFIQYYSFEVAPDTTARVTVEDPDEIVSGFEQTINVSVYNDSDWEGAFDDMWIHVTGLEANYSGTLYEDDDIITLGTYADLSGYTSDNDRYAYYEFDIKFEETGTATVIVTHPYNNSIYSDDEYNNTDYQANISGTTTFSVVSPDDMNILVTGMPDAVMVDDTGCAWLNESTQVTINVYGDDEDTPMNASITIMGAGVDIEIDEDDAVDDGYQTAGQTGVYTVDISPKYAGTVTISVENDTENMTGSKDFAIKGLSGSVTTSIGDDLEMSVQSTEAITVSIVNGQYGEVHLTYYDENWQELACLNDTVGENEAGNGLNGEFEFIVTDEDIEDGVGFIVVAAQCGSDFFLYDVVEVAPIHDLMFEVIDPEDALNQTFTVGLEHDWEFKVMDENGNLIDDIDEVTGEILDEDDDVLQEFSLEEKSGSIWYMDEFIPYYQGSMVLTAVNNSGGNEHDGNITFDVGLATFTFSPAATTAGIGIENLTVEITGVDANGNPLPDGTSIYLNIDEADSDTDPADGDSLSLDEDGMGEFEIEEVCDLKGKINFTFNQAYDANDEAGNVSNGQFDILYPVFVVDPPEIYIGQSNQVTITAYDQNNEPIEGINLTLLPSTIGIIGSQPDPVETDATGQAVLSVSPVASGKLNVTIARDLEYIGGQLNWTNSVVTDTVITVTSLKTLTVELSKSPIFQGETLTVTVKSGTNMVSDATVKFGQESKTTGSNGEATFTVPDPGVESAVYKVTASKTGYTSTTEDLTVIKKYAITIVGPTGDITTGQQVTVTILAKGSALAGATITFEGNTYTSNENGKVTFTMPDTEGTYTVTATYEEYTDGTLTITISPGGVPGFEVLTLLAAIGVAFILLRRRQH